MANLCKWTFQTVSALHTQTYIHSHARTQTVTETHFRCCLSLSHSLLLDFRITFAHIWYAVHPCHIRVFISYSCSAFVLATDTQTVYTFIQSFYIACHMCPEIDLRFYLCVAGIRFSKMHCLFCVNAWLEIRNR